MPPYVAVGVHPRHDFLPGIAALIQAKHFPCAIEATEEESHGSHAFSRSRVNGQQVDKLPVLLVPPR
jgi:hypothetical protein